MLKAFLFAVGLTAILTSGASAETRFRGHVDFSAVDNCKSSGVQAGWQFRSEFHARLEGNGDFSALSLVYDYGAIGHRLEGKDFTSSYQTVTLGGVGWGDGYVPDKKGAVLISSQQPKVISASTPTVVLVGKMKNPWGDPGAELCEVTFRGVYVQLIN